MGAGSMRRFLRRRGRPAVYREVATSGSDAWGDPTSSTTTDVETVALVRPRGQPALVRSPAGERVETDADLLLPDDVAVDPTAEDHRSVVVVSGERYKVWSVEPGELDGTQLLRATRSGRARVFTDEFTDEFE